MEEKKIYKNGQLYIENQNQEISSSMSRFFEKRAVDTLEQIYKLNQKLEANPLDEILKRKIEILDNQVNRWLENAEKAKKIKEAKQTYKDKAKEKSRQNAEMKRKIVVKEKYLKKLETENAKMKNNLAKLEKRAEKIENEEKETNAMITTEPSIKRTLKSIIRIPEKIIRWGVKNFQKVFKKPEEIPAKNVEINKEIEEHSSLDGIVINGYTLEQQAKVAADIQEKVSKEIKEPTQENNGLEKE